MGALRLAHVVLPLAVPSGLLGAVILRLVLTALLVAPRHRNRRLVEPGARRVALGSPSAGGMRCTRSASRTASCHSGTRTPAASCTWRHRRCTAGQPCTATHVVPGHSHVVSSLHFASSPARAAHPFFFVHVWFHWHDMSALHSANVPCQTAVLLHALVRSHPRAPVVTLARRLLPVPPATPSCLCTRPSRCSPHTRRVVRALRERLVHHAPLLVLALLARPTAQGVRLARVPLLHRVASHRRVCTWAPQPWCPTSTSRPRCTKPPRGVRAHTFRWHIPPDHSHEFVVSATHVAWSQCAVQGLALHMAPVASHWQYESTLHSAPDSHW
eukprot:Sspe_Gene.1703::Locus_568_Transcript_3_4_Confidence_0.167_Length_2842::g.1703::m.1703